MLFDVDSLKDSSPFEALSTICTMFAIDERLDPDMMRPVITSSADMMKAGAEGTIVDGDIATLCVRALAIFLGRVGMPSGSHWMLDSCDAMFGLLRGESLKRMQFRQTTLTEFVDDLMTLMSITATHWTTKFGKQDFPALANLATVVGVAPREQGKILTVMHLSIRMMSKTGSGVTTTSVKKLMLEHALPLISNVLSGMADIPNEAFGTDLEELMVACFDLLLLGVHRLLVVKGDSPVLQFLGNTMDSQLRMALSSGDSLLPSRAHIILAVIAELARSLPAWTVSCEIMDSLLSLADHRFQVETQSGAANAAGKLSFDDPFASPGSGGGAGSPRASAALGDTSSRSIARGAWLLPDVRWLLVDTLLSLSRANPEPPAAGEGADAAAGASTASPSLGRTFRWCWMTDDEAGRPYDEASCRILTDNYTVNRKSASLDLDGGHYTIDFPMLRQFASSSGRKRNVNFQPVVWRYPRGSPLPTGWSGPEPQLRVQRMKDMSHVKSCALLLAQFSAVTTDLALKPWLDHLTLSMLSVVRSSGVPPDPILVDFIINMLPTHPTEVAIVSHAIVSGTSKGQEGGQWMTLFRRSSMSKELRVRFPELIAVKEERGVKRRRTTKAAAGRTQKKEAADLIVANPVKAFYDLVFAGDSESDVDSATCLKPPVIAEEGVADIDGLVRFVTETSRMALIEWLQSLAVEQCNAVLEVLDKFPAGLQSVVAATHDIIDTTLAASLALAAEPPAPPPVQPPGRAKKGRKTQRASAAAPASVPVAQSSDQAASTNTATKVSVLSATYRQTYGVILCRAPVQSSTPKKKKMTEVERARDAARCPGGHRLTAHHSVGWTCNVCNRHDDELGSMSCRKCDFDICVECFDLELLGQFSVAPIATVGQLLHTAMGGARNDDGRQGGVMGLLLAMFGGSGTAEAMAAQLHSQQVSLQDISAQLTMRGQPVPTSLPVAALLLQNPNIHPVYARCIQHLAYPSEEQRKTIGGDGYTLVHCYADSQSQRCRCGSVSRLPSHPLAPAVEPPSSFPPIVDALYLYEDTTARAGGDNAAALRHQHDGVLGRLHQQMMKDANAIAAIQEVAIPPTIWQYFTKYHAFIPLTFRRDVAKFVFGGAWKALVEGISRRGVPVAGTVRVDVSPSGDKIPIDVVRGPKIIESADRIFRQAPPIRTKLDLKFQDEAGTGDGPNQEFYAEVGSVLTADLNHWRLSDDGLLGAELFPSSKKEFCREFFVLGACYSRSFLDGFWMAVPMHPAVWVLAVAGGSAAPHTSLMQALRLLDSKLHTQMEELLTADHDKLQMLGFDLDGQTNDALVKEMVNDTFGSSLKNIDAFMNGFQVFLPRALLDTFTCQELSTVFCGLKDDSSPRFSLDELRACIVGANGYATSSPEVAWFIDILVNHFSVQEQTYFVEWLTGTPRLPPGGITRLGRSIQVVKKDMDAGIGTLPSCNTCFLYVKLPSYQSKEVMAEKLRIAVTDGRRNFALS